MRVSHRRTGQACGYDLGTTTCHKSRDNPLYQFQHDIPSTATKVALPFWPSSGCLHAHSLQLARGLGFFHRNSTLLENHSSIALSLGFKQVSPQGASDTKASGKFSSQPRCTNQRSSCLRVGKASVTNMCTLNPLVSRRLDLHSSG
jgi:hypothetical protein